MTDPQLLDQAFHRLMRSLVESGRALHCGELAREMGLAVRGEQKWFAQCGFEATSVTWLFPGMTVRVEAPCLDCGDLMVVEMRDGTFVTVDPPGIVGHLNYGFGPS